MPLLPDLFRPAMVLALGLSVIAAPALAQNQDGARGFQIPTNHAFPSIGLPNTSPGPSRPGTTSDHFYGSLRQFGRCVVAADPRGANAVRAAYARHTRGAVDAALARLQPVLIDCRMRTGAPRDAGWRPTQLAAIGDALRERDIPGYPVRQGF